jgi:hypothetical protein
MEQTVSIVSTNRMVAHVPVIGSVQILSHIRSGDGFGLHDLIERPHVHVAFGGPCSAGDVAQPRGCQVEARLAVRECSNDTGSAANLFHDPLERIIGADLLPVDVREGVIRSTGGVRDEM